jgi:hypothetical protein
MKLFSGYRIGQCGDNVCVSPVQMVEFRIEVDVEDMTREVRQTLYLSTNVPHGCHKCRGSAHIPGLLPAQGAVRWPSLFDDVAARSQTFRLKRNCCLPGLVDELAKPVKRGFFPIISINRQQSRIELLGDFVRRSLLRLR